SAGGVARLRGRRRKTDAPCVSVDGDPGLWQHRHPLYVVRNGSGDRRPVTGRAWDGDRSVPEERRPVAEHWLATGAGGEIIYSALRNATRSAFSRAVSLMRKRLS